MKRGELSLNTERVRLQAELTLEFKLVLAARSKLSLSLRSTGIDNSVKYSTAFAAAFWNDWAMVVGWIPAQHQKGQFRENQGGVEGSYRAKGSFPQQPTDFLPGRQPMSFRLLLQYPARLTARQAEGTTANFLAIDNSNTPSANAPFVLRDAEQPCASRWSLRRW